MSFPQISDSPGDIFARFGVPSQPALVVVNANGDAQLFFGAVDEAILQTVLAEAAAG